MVPPIVIFALTIDQQRESWENRGIVAPSKPKPVPNPPPAAAYHLEVEGDEFVVFVWNTEATEPALSKSLREVLALILRGCTNSEIALARGTSERTIANQVARLLKEFGAGSRFELIARLGPARVDR